MTKSERDRAPHLATSMQGPSTRKARLSKCAAAVPRRRQTAWCAGQL